MKKDSVKKNYIYNLTFQILNILLPLVTTPYISRVLGAENIGIYSYTYSFVSTFVLVGSLGVGTYGQREIASVSDNVDERSQFFWEIFIVKSISITISVLLFSVFTLFYKNYSFYLLIQIPYFLAAILDISWLFQGIEKFKFVAIRNIIIKLVSLVLIFLLVKTSKDLYLYIILLSVSQLSGNFTMWFNLNKFVKKSRITPTNLKRHIKPAFVYFVPTIAYQIHAVLDKTMLGLIYQSNAENGYYEQAHKIINMATMFVSSFNVVMRSRMTVLFAKNQLDKFKESYRNSLRFVCLLVFPMAFGMAAVASNLVPWFLGDGYEKVIILLYIFCPMFILQGLRSCVGSNLITPSRRQSKGNIAQCASAVTNISLNAILIKPLASVGSSIVSVISEFVLLVFYLKYTKDFTNFKEIVKTASKYFFASIIMFIPTFYMSSMLKPSIIATFSCIFVGILIYFSVLLIMRDSFVIEKICNIYQHIKIKR